MMTREQYIKYRLEDKMLQVLYEFFLEKGMFHMDYEAFTFFIDKWLLNLVKRYFSSGVVLDKNQLYQEIGDMVVEYYDVKFTIVYLVTEIKTEIKESKTFIL